MEEHVHLELTPDEIIVLFEYLARAKPADRDDLEDQAEQRVLWDLEAMCEPLIPSLLGPDYAEQLEMARARVRDPAE